VALVTILAFGGAAHALRLTRVPEAAYRPDFKQVPLQIGTFKGRDLPIDESIYRYLAASGMLERDYEGPSGGVRLTVLYAADWRSIHSPSGCLPAAGWEIVSDVQVDFPAPPSLGTREPLRGRLVRAHKGEAWLLVLYSFGYYGGTTADWTEMASKVTAGPRGAGGLVFTLSTPVLPNLAEAEQRLAEVLAGAYPGAIAFWRQGAPPGAGR